MEGKTLSIATYRTKLDENFEIMTQDPTERSSIEQGMRKTAERIERDMDPYKAAAQLDCDEVIALDELRQWMVLLTECAYQSIGYRRIKNPRIWSLHDLNRLSLVSGGSEQVTQQGVTQQKIVEREGCQAIIANMPGTFWSRPKPGEAQFIQKGNTIKLGQNIALIEVMKTFSAIKSGVTGVFQGWEKEDGASVLRGDVLGWIQSDS